MSDFYNFLQQSDAAEAERVRLHRQMYPHRALGHNALQQDTRTPTEIKLDSLNALRIPDMVEGSLAYLNEREWEYSQWQSERVQGQFTAEVEYRLIRDGYYGVPSLYGTHP